MNIHTIYIAVAYLFLGSNVTQALTLEERISALESQQSQHEVEKVDSALNSPYSFSGFGSFTASQLTQDAVLPSGETNRLLVTPNSLMGLQFGVQLSDTTRAVTQIVAEGNEDFQTEIEWLFIEQQLFSMLAVKLGRFGYPVYSESSNGKVAYSYPTVSLADEVYVRTLIESIDGVSFDIQQNIASWDARLTVYGGERELYKRHENVDIAVTGAYGVSLNADNGPWNFRLSWHTVNEYDITFHDIDFPVCSGVVGSCPLQLMMKVKQFQGAARYEGENWYLAYEVSLLSSDYEYVGDIYGQSFTAAYSIATYQPYIQWGDYQTRLDDKSLDIGSNNRQQQSVALGLRHDFHSGVAVKYQAKYLYGFEGSDGLFNFYNSETIDFSDAWAFDISLQFVFDTLL